MEATLNNGIVNATSVFNLELFFESSPDLICVAGYDGYFKKINPTVSKILGYSNDELFASPINSFIHSDDQQITAHNRERLTRNTPLLNFENRYVAKNGEIIWLSWTSTPIESEQLVFAIAKNITYKKRQEEDRNSIIATLTRTNNDLKQLTYATSHDLRSPVSNLLSVFNLLDINTIQDVETLEFIGMLKLATNNLKDTLNGYVDALAEKNVLSIAVEELDIETCLRSVLLSLKSLLTDSKTAVTFDFSHHPVIKFNKVYLESVFLNLITNSIKYTLPNEPPAISVTSRRKNNVTQIIYKDKGRGFDMKKVKDKIFGFSQRFHDDECSDSKGIGLYLVYNHITCLGGRIAIDSEPGKGATFTISLRD